MYIQFTPGETTDCQFEFCAFIIDKQPKPNEIYRELCVIKALNLDLILNYYLFKSKIIEFYKI